MSTATASDFENAPARVQVTPLLLAIGCVALADWLFYGWQIGISLALFLGILGGAALFSNHVQASRLIPCCVFAVGLLPLVEQVDVLSISVAMLATAMSVIAATSRELMSWQRQLLEAVTIPFRGPFQLTGDVIRSLRHMNIWTPGWLAWLVGWIVPLSVFAIFLMLISSANPLIENTLTAIDLRKLLASIDPVRIAFWLFIACLIWPLVFRRAKSKPVREFNQPAPSADDATPDLDHLFGARAITRSLVLFNALFALQTTLDLAYLWGGAALPDGMTYASYSHRGAYPLIATALLAAGFVLLAMRPGGPAEHSRLIRPLVLVWIAQNILLVFSSIFRLDLYVAVYSLTYLRLAAFVWMGLVAVGLALILVQIKLRKSNSWLLTANAISLAAVLYGCCFINAPALIASYNVEHAREVSGAGVNLDWHYLASLGPQALPALERHRDKFPTYWQTMSGCHNKAREALSVSKNWRSFSFRTWRLEQYFAKHPVPALSGQG